MKLQNDSCTQSSDIDCEVRIWYCRWFQESLYNNIPNQELLYYVDEASFRLSLDWELLFYVGEASFGLSGYVSSHSSRYWCTESPHIDNIYYIPVNTAFFQHIFENLYRYKCTAFSDTSSPPPLIIPQSESLGPSTIHQYGEQHTGAAHSSINRCVSVHKETL
jgi:hypothetical protein